MVGVLHIDWLFNITRRRGNSLKFAETQPLGAVFHTFLPQ